MAAWYGNDVMSWKAGSVSGTPGTENSFLDTSPPTAPTNVTANVISPSRIDLASTDSQSGVAHYVVYRNDESLATTSTTTYQDATAVAGVSYSYRVSAVNRDGFASAHSTPPVNVTIVGIELVAVSDSQTVVLRFSEPVTAASA